MIAGDDCTEVESEVMCGLTGLHLLLADMMERASWNQTSVHNVPTNTCFNILTFSEGYDEAVLGYSTVCM